MEVLLAKLCRIETLLEAWKIVKQKNAAGGIDGFTVARFDEQLDRYLNEIQSKLKDGTWNPRPYLQVVIKKNDTEKRKLGLLSIQDKIVQQAIMMLIEPKLEKLFVSNSYGYRPGKGHTRAIKRAIDECKKKKSNWILRLDIDNYFDTINHDILFNRLRPLVGDDEVMRLIELSVKMGVVTHRLGWNEITEGIPQGAILSPLLANLYLHPFDQFVLTRISSYVRYADDFVLLCQTREQANNLLKEATSFLESRLRLRLNPPVVDQIKNGFEFLGITLGGKDAALSEKKEKELEERIQSVRLTGGCFPDKSLKALNGIKNYYGSLLPQKYLLRLDTLLQEKLYVLIRENYATIPNKTILRNSLKQIDFYAVKNILQKNTIRQRLVDYYLDMRSQNARKQGEVKNKKLIEKRKNEYRQKEAEGAELIVSTPGTFIGVTQKGLSIKIYGKLQSFVSSPNLGHIVIITSGVSLSGNAIGYCMEQKIPIDFFDNRGKFCASILSPHFLQTSLWEQQAVMSPAKKVALAVKIIEAKIRNQLNLIKYYHKYHKAAMEQLKNIYNDTEPRMKALIRQTALITSDNENCKQSLLGIESQAAVLYWNYIRTMLSDDRINFSGRERHGATDLMNCMLNYGYSLLYARVWQALLFYKLNPADSLVHEPQPGRPTLVYDVIEMFRSQGVDRVVISLVQKKEPLEINGGLLTGNTRKLLAQNLAERFNRYEKYRGKEQKFLRIIQLQAKEMAAYIAEDNRYKPYIAKW